MLPNTGQPKLFSGLTVLAKLPFVPVMCLLSRRLFVTEAVLEPN